MLEFELKAEGFREEWSTDEGVLLRETGDGGEGLLKERSRVAVEGDLLTSFDKKFGAMINLAEIRCQMDRSSSNASPDLVI